MTAPVSDQGDGDLAEESRLRQRALESVSLQVSGSGSSCPVVEDLRLLVLEGAALPGDSGTPQDSRPEWYDAELFHEGQRCALRYLAGIGQSQLLSLFLMFIVPNGLDPLIATGRSDTPFAAFQRYLSTALRLLSWYEGDPFDPSSLAWRNLVAVRRMHSAVRTLCTNTPKEELAVKFTIGKTASKDDPSSLWCPMTPFLVEEFKKIPSGQHLVVESDRYGRPFLSQSEMGITQFSFFGLFVLHPGLFGAPYVTRRELEGLVHMWAVLGHCLGVQDKFNWCQGGLDATRKRSQDLLDYYMRSSFQLVTPEWEHMSRCAFEGIKMYGPGLGHIESHFAYLFEDVLQLHTALPRKLSWSQWFQLLRMRFFFQILPRWFPSVITLAGKTLRVVTLRASRLSKESLRRLQDREFPFSAPRTGTVPLAPPAM